MNALGAANWIRENADTIGEFLAQAGGTAAGMAAGAFTGPAAPVAIPAGAAAGNVAGKMGYRALRGLDQPETSEMLVDAGLGASGPVAGTLLRSTARAGTGLRQGNFRRGMRDVEPAIQDYADEMAELGFAQNGISRTTQQMRANSASSEVNRAIAEASAAGPTIRRGITGGTAGALAAFTGEPITSALIGAGISEAVLSRAGPALLQSKIGVPFAKWALNVGGQRPAEAWISFNAIFAGKELPDEVQKARDAIAAELRKPRSETTAGGRRSSVESPKRPRDARGRYLPGSDGLSQDELDVLRG